MNNKKQTKKVKQTQETQESQNRKWKIMTGVFGGIALASIIASTTTAIIVSKNNSGKSDTSDVRIPEAEIVDITVSDVQTTTNGTQFKIATVEEKQINKVVVTIGTQKLSDSEFSYNPATKIATIPMSTLKKYSGNIKVSAEFVDNTYVYLDYTTAEMMANDTTEFSIPYVKSGNGYITWSSSDENVATVDKSTGVVKLADGLFAGTTVTITAHAGKNTSSCVITVKSLPTEPITPEQPEPKVHEIFQYEDVGISGIEGWTIKATTVAEDKAYMPEDVEIPTVHQGKPVLKIGSFSGFTNIKTIKLPNTIAGINALAFNGCTSLTNINIPKSVMSIGMKIFNGLTASGKLAVNFESQSDWTLGTTETFSPHTMEHTAVGDAMIGQSAVLTKNGVSDEEGNFMYYFTSEITCSVAPKNTTATELTIPETITDESGNVYKVDAIMYDYAQKKSSFYDFNKLEKITIPKTIEEIHEGTFATCSALKEIDVDAHNPNYATYDGVLYNKSMEKLLRYPAKKVTSKFVVPNYVKEIGKSSFAKATQLQEVIFDPNLSELTTIGIGAFQQSTIVTINIPKKCTHINYDVFLSCSKLTSVTFEDPNNWIINDAASTAFVATDAGNNATNLKNFYHDSCYYGISKKSA